jgi:hypothetical protein
MNVIVAAAKRYEIKPFVSMSVLTYSNYRETDHRQFKADLDHYVTQLILDKSLRSRQDTVAILPNSKERIRRYVSGLRQCIEQANMTDAKREALFQKLEAFEAELEKRRLNTMMVARFSYFILSMPGTIWASAEITHKLVTSVMQVVAEAKAAEVVTKALPAAAPPKALSAPREVKQSAFAGCAFSNDLDDDVPF